MADSMKENVQSPSIEDNKPAPERLKPQTAGWSEKTPLNYSNISATHDAAQALIDQGAVESWQSTAVKYEWIDSYGEVGDADPELEKELFDPEKLTVVGDGITNLMVVNVFLDGEDKVAPVRAFADAGLHPVMIDNLRKCTFEIPTPIQAYCIPAILSGREILGVAQTGSGKTGAYLIPILSKLMGKAKKLTAPKPSSRDFDFKTNGVVAEPIVLIIVPTRELAAQIFNVARRLCYRSMLRPCVVYGGAPTRMQRTDLARGCDILIGTPGRLVDFVINARAVNLHRLKYIILDEADEMIQSDWEEKLRPLLHSGATFQKQYMEVAKTYLAKDHLTIQVGRPGSTHQGIQQEVIWVEPDQKKRALYDLLMSTPPCRTAIFTNLAITTDQVDDFLYNNDFPCTAMTAQRTQREREDALRAFTEGHCPILVTSHLVARGIDIPNVMHIINYDLPSTMHGGIDAYVHRIGRTARIGHVGLATAFFNDKNSDIAPALTKILLECKQDVPEFLEQYKPEDPENLNFDEDDVDAGLADQGQVTQGHVDGNQTSSWGDNGDNGDNAVGGDVWGTSAENNDGAPVAGGAWKTESGW